METADAQERAYGAVWGQQYTTGDMQRFYHYLWNKGLPPDDALWQAKKEFIRRDRPLIEWAGWVFSGVPEARR